MHSRLRVVYHVAADTVPFTKSSTLLISLRAGIKSYSHFFKTQLLAQYLAHHRFSMKAELN